MTVRMIDAYGKVRIDGGSVIQARLIQATPLAIAAFPASDPKVPILLMLESPPRVNGKNVTATLIGGGSMEFQRASCGCQTPSSLRGPARRFLDLVPAPADA